MGEPPDSTMVLRFADTPAAWGLLNDPGYRPVKVIRFSITWRGQAVVAPEFIMAGRRPDDQGPIQRRGPAPRDVIYPAEFEAPRLDAGQALVEVVPAPINPSDVMTLTGEYGQLPPLSAIGGREGAGRVAELGADTGDIAVGQLVLLPVGCGSRSTQVVTEAAQLTPLPSEADPLQLSMMTINPPRAALLLDPERSDAEVDAPRPPSGHAQARLRVKLRAPLNNRVRSARSYSTFGSILREHSPSPQISHNKRHGLLEGRVGDAST